MLSITEHHSWSSDKRPKLAYMKIQITDIKVATSLTFFPAKLNK